MNDGKNIAPAKPASSILLIRNGMEGLEVLMMKRAETMRFAPGAYVFPGGKVDKTDSRKSFWRSLVDAYVMPHDFHYRVAALRELYEEVGILYGDYKPGFRIARSRSLARAAVREKLCFHISKLEFFAHWVTPEPMPRRFDTYFYLAPYNGQIASVDGNEAVSLMWVNPRNILKDWQEDKIPLMFPTRLNLMKLARANNVRSAMRLAKSSQVVKTMPTVKAADGNVSISISPECGYDVTKATTREILVERPASSK